jgi:hypothetical protein
MVSFWAPKCDAQKLTMVTFWAQNVTNPGLVGPWPAPREEPLSWPLGSGFVLESSKTYPYPRGLAGPDVGDFGTHWKRWGDAPLPPNCPSSGLLCGGTALDNCVVRHILGNRPAGRFPTISPTT